MSGIRLVTVEEEAGRQARLSEFVSSTFEVYHEPSCFHVRHQTRWGVHPVPKDMLAEMRACNACRPDEKDHS